MQKLTPRSLLALGALGATLLPLAGQAEAAPKPQDKSGPPDYAPAYGRRNRDGGRYNGDGSNDDSVRYGGYGRTVTLEGIVTSTDGNGDFQVQAGGKSFDVTSQANVRVRTGQRVTLRGSFEGDNNFTARTVTLATRGDVYGNGTYGNGTYGNGTYGNGTYGNGTYGNGTYGNGTYGNGTYGNGTYGNGTYGNGTYGGYGGGYGSGTQSGLDQRVNFPGVVTRVNSSGELEVRADNGRTYHVTPRSDSSQYQVGNRIRVAGTSSGNRVDGARITFQNGGITGGTFGNGGVFGGNRGDDGNYGGSYGSGSYGSGYGGYNGGFQDGKKVDFNGRIVRINTEVRTTTATVRGDNGRDYTIRTKDLKNFHNGQHIRVQGTVKNGVVEASDID